MTTDITTPRRDAASLREEWALYRTDNPTVRIRDAAAALGVPEAGLLATGCGDGVTRLTGDWRELFPRLESIGRAMALTRNEQIVHETTGTYRDVSFEHHVGMVLGDGIDIRLFMHSWGDAFAVTEETTRGIRRSLQFFDRAGAALHKIYLRDDDGIGPYEGIVADFRSADQGIDQRLDPPPAATTERPDEEVDTKGLLYDWRGMTNTHQFHTLLATYGLTRTQAFRLVGREMAEPVAPQASYRHVLRQAVETEVPIMIFVGNHGCMQIHTGRIERLVEIEGWFNVLDPGFNLHIREEGIASAWIVRKPTEEAFVTSLELYDARGENLAIFFGSRKESKLENADWRAILRGVPKE